MAYLYYSNQLVRPLVSQSVRPHVCQSVRQSLFCPEHNLKLCKASTWNFIGSYISLRRSAVHTNQNSRHHTFGVIALCWTFFFRVSVLRGYFRYAYTTEKMVYLKEWDYNLKLLKYRDISILMCCRMAKSVYEVHVEETAVYGYLALHYALLT